MSPERFTAMGVEVVVGGARPYELEDVRRLFDLWDRTFSPFLDASELAHVNKAPTRLVAVSPLFARGRCRARGGSTDARARRSDFRFAGGGLDDPAADGSAAPATARHGARLNGVVKGLAADAALELVSGRGFVSAGGDVAGRGAAVVGLPGGGSLRLEDAGLATSGTTRWKDHLVDPRTGHTSGSRWTEVTVAAASCLAADGRREGRVSPL
jgi:thiamine biosynthesis lipoprotein ApbE